MTGRQSVSGFVILLLVFVAAPAVAIAQATGSIRGTVRLGADAVPVHGARVTILPLRRSVETDDDGGFAFSDVPPGSYHVVAHLDRVQDKTVPLELAAGESEVVDILLEVSSLRESVTVTATGNEELTSNSIQSVDVIGSVELARNNPISLGEALEHESGIAKRSFGPGTARPVIRGFDNDRVLVLQDGNRIGGLGFQSGDHAEPINVLSLERVEVVKGPATLLYGSSAIGGVVNAIVDHTSPMPGVRGYFTGIGSTNNWQAGANAGMEAGTNRFLFWANGGAQRVGDYETPLGRVTYSWARSSSFTTGVGFFPDKGWFNIAYTFDDQRYGIPFAVESDELEHDDHDDDHDLLLREDDHDEDEHGHEHGPVFLTPRRHSLKLDAGMRDLDGFFEGMRFSIQFNDYKHAENEAETGEIGTRFSNDTFLYRGSFDHADVGRFRGTFGFWGEHRNFKAVGEEAIAPPTSGNAFALFALETLDLEKVVLQFGGRVEHNAYDPEPLLDDELGRRERSFTGFSGALGVRVPVWEGGSFVANYTHSYRAPALEELYNLGPHPGNLAFEIGNPSLGAERSNGLDVGLRHVTDHLRASANVYFYDLSDYIFLAPTGDEEDELIVARYVQGDARYAGFEAELAARVHPNLWLGVEGDYVNAELTETDTPLPRIPPLSGRAWAELTYGNFRIGPELLVANEQDRLFPNETRTPGYAIVNVNASYTLATDHTVHVISVDAFNLTDRLYYNHLSFIKDFAPEIGRGVRAAYTVRFF